MNKKKKKDFRVLIKSQALGEQLVEVSQGQEIKTVFNQDMPEILNKSLKEPDGFAGVEEFETALSFSENVHHALAELAVYSKEKHRVEQFLIPILANSFQEFASKLDVNQAHAFAIAERLRDSESLFAGPVNILKGYSINKTIVDKSNGYSYPLDKGLCLLAEKMANEVISEYERALKTVSSLQ